MASTGRVALKSKLRESNANYMDNLTDSIMTLVDGGVMAAGSVFGLGIQAVTATGANQGNGASISATGGSIVNVTAADGTKAVVLPTIASVTLGTIFVILNNNGSNALEVFPGSGDKINPASDDAAITVAADTILLCIALDATQWFGSELPIVGA